MQTSNIERQRRAVMREPLYTVGATGYDGVFGRVTGLFVPTLLQAARLAPGQHVLDVATGTGATAEAAAAIVGSSGTVVAGDISPAMLDVARRKLHEARVTLESVDAHALPYPDERFDAVICQLGLMLFSDPARALAEFHRVLRPGGRVAVSVSTTPERTLFLRIGAAIARHVPTRAQTFWRYFDIPNTGSLRALLAGAGFRDIQVESECRELQFVSFDDYFSGIENGATLSGQEYVRLPENVRRVVREDVQRGVLVGKSDGPVAINMEVLIGSGQRQPSAVSVLDNSRSRSKRSD
jgi:ubiquinone/menaquinone biosynthesis C-methylase UbiE